MKWPTFVMLLIFAAVAWAIVSSTCKGNPYEAPVITSMSEFNAKTKEAEEISTAPLLKFEAGETLNESDIDALKRGAAITKGLIGFRPQSVTLYIGLAKSYLAIGDDGNAHQWAQDGIGTIDPQSKDKRLKMVEADLHYISATALEHARMYDKAQFEGTYAVDILKGDPTLEKLYEEMDTSYKHALATYMARLASIKVQIAQLPADDPELEDELRAAHKEQMEKYQKMEMDDARALVTEALKMDPDNLLAKQLSLLFRAKS